MKGKNGGAKGDPDAQGASDAAGNSALARSATALCEKCGRYEDFSRLKLMSKKSDCQTTWRCKGCMSKTVMMSQLKLKLPPNISEADEQEFWKTVPNKKEKIKGSLQQLKTKYVKNEEYHGRDGMFKPKEFWLQQGYTQEYLEKQEKKDEDGMVLYKVSVQAMGKRTIEGQEDSSSLQAIFKKQRTNATASSSAAPSAAALKEDEDSNSSSSDSSDSSSDASNDGVDAARHMIAQGASNYLSSTALPTHRS